MRRMSSLRPQISWRTTTPGRPEPAAAPSGRASEAASEPPDGSGMRRSSVPNAAIAARYPDPCPTRSLQTVTILELAPASVAAGGDGIARDADGRVAFVEGGIPGDVVRAEVVDQRRDFVRTRAVEVLEASPDRVEPPCPFVLAGCGGCQWQHV